MIVLGVDPGTQVTGYGVVSASGGSELALVECGAVRPSARLPLAERLLEIFDGVSEVIERTRPDVLCVEGAFYGRNVKTAMILGHARAATMLAAAARGVPVVEYPPAEVKSAVVGSGRASKGQVAFMVRKHLSLAEAPTPADAADGVALALCHVFHLRRRGGLRGAGGGVGRKRDAS
jgi:crossover junction endodeoxyribonuclease RuvC